MVFHYIPNQLENAGSNTWKLSLDSRINDNFQVDWVYHVHCSTVPGWF
ncbi:MAG: hypothetical protein LC437_08640 [Thiohalomonas sp.]|nr:hypothetical protein [Thiohalomonas sp.]